MFAFEFMYHAFMASGIVAILAGISGYFLLLRREVFAGHALSHIGFAGATGAGLLGMSPFGGLLFFSVCAAGFMGAIGSRLKDRDIAVGLVLSASMGLGLLFLHFYVHYATQVSSLLFGNVFAVDRTVLYDLCMLAVFFLLVMLFFMRPLLFASLQPDLAETRGVSLRWVSVLFLILVACVTVACVQVTGILLTFSLMIGPAAVARTWARTVWQAMLASVILAILEAWSGIVMAWWTDSPVSFWISGLSLAIYLICLLFVRIKKSLFKECM